jgi:hypothetical protein
VVALASICGKLSVVGFGHSRIIGRVSRNSRRYAAKGFSMPKAAAASNLRLAVAWMKALDVSIHEEGQALVLNQTRYDTRIISGEVALRFGTLQKR